MVPLSSTTERHLPSRDRQFGGYSLKKLAFNSQATCIRIDNPGYGTIDEVYCQNWRDHAIYIDVAQSYSYLGNVYGIEGEGGWHTRLKLRGDTAAGTTQYSCVYTYSGYFKSLFPHCLGAKFGYWFDCSRFPAGAPEWYGGLFEEQDVAGIYITDADSGQECRMVLIDNPEFSVFIHGLTRSNAQGHIILQPTAHESGRYLRTALIKGVRASSIMISTAAFINAGSGDDVTIESCQLERRAGNLAKGIVVGVQVVRAVVRNNTLTGAFGTKYQLTAAALLYDDSSQLTVSEVNAITCANGSRAWAVDGDPTKPNALTGSGIGCWAERRGGAWYPSLDLSNAPTGYGTPTGGVLLANFPGATATLGQTTAALAQLLLHLKAQGVIKA